VHLSDYPAHLVFHEEARVFNGKEKLFDVYEGLDYSFRKDNSPILLKLPVNI
jgi:hypothetical protein